MIAESATTGRLREVAVKASRTVNLCAKTEYACIAVLDLAARRQSREPIRLREIAERHGIPPRFLVQVLLQLKGAGVVASTRGAAGGYKIARKPEEITLGEVVEIMEGSGEAKSNAAASTPITRVLSEAWGRVVDEQRRLLREITFADLVDELRGQADSMYYI